MSSEPLVHRRDVLGAPGLLLLAAASRLPPSQWRPVCRLAGRALVGLRSAAGGTPRGLAARVRAALGGRRLPVAPEAIRVRQAAVRLESFLQMARAARDVGFAASIRLHGREHLDAALAAGRGAVLHVLPFHPTLHLAALPAHGYRIHRITDATHGYFLFSRFGRRFLHPYQSRLEHDEGVARIVAREGSIAHLRRAMRALRANEPVLFRALNPVSAPGVRSVIRVPLLSGRLPLSTTPLGVAVDSGAPLIPVYPIDDGGYRVVLAAPLSRGRAAGRRARVEALARAQARDLERMVLRYPDQWMEWNVVETAE